MSFQAVRLKVPSERSGPSTLENMSSNSNVVALNEKNNSWSNWKIPALVTSNMVVSLAVKYMYSSSYIPLVPIVNTIIYLGAPYGIEKVKNCTTKAANDIQQRATKIQKIVQQRAAKVQKVVRSVITKVEKVDRNFLLTAGISLGVILLDPTLLTVSSTVSSIALIYHKEIREKFSEPKEKLNDSESGAETTAKPNPLDDQGQQESDKLQEKQTVSKSKIVYMAASVLTLGLLPLVHKIYNIVGRFFDVSDFFQLDDLNIGRLESSKSSASYAQNKVEVEESSDDSDSENQELEIDPAAIGFGEEFHDSDELP